MQLMNKIRLLTAVTLMTGQKHEEAQEIAAENARPSPEKRGAWRVLAAKTGRNPFNPFVVIRGEVLHENQAASDLTDLRGLL